MHEITTSPKLDRKRLGALTLAVLSLGTVVAAATPTDAGAVRTTIVECPEDTCGSNHNEVMVGLHG